MYIARCRTLEPSARTILIDDLIDIILSVSDFSKLYMFLLLLTASTVCHLTVGGTLIPMITLATYLTSYEGSRIIKKAIHLIIVNPFYHVSLYNRRLASFFKGAWLVAEHCKVGAPNLLVHKDVTYISSPFTKVKFA